MGTRRVLTGVVISCLCASPAVGQAPGDLVDRGLAAYDELDFDAAAGLIRAAFAAGATSVIQPDRQRQALTVLGAAEVFRGNADSARSAFRQLFVAFPFAQIDELVFPPEVTSLFQRVKATVPAVQVTAPVGRQEVVVGQGAYVVSLTANTSHTITATIARGDGRIVQTLFTGPVGASHELRWDGRDTTGALLRSGSYVLSVMSGLRMGAWQRTVQLPLQVEVQLADTLLHPGPVPDSLLLPEVLDRGPAMEALVGGLASGLAIVVIPSLAGSSADLGASRFAVGAAVSVAGVVGFLTQRPGSPIPTNISYNQALYADRQDSAAVITQLNAGRQRVSVLLIRAGVPSRAELGRQ